MILLEAGLIRALDYGTIGKDGFCWKAQCLTWARHEFLDAARINTIWNEAKSKMSHFSGAVTFDIMKDILVMGIKENLGRQP
jgi:hypothetical protein